MKTNIYQIRAYLQMQRIACLLLLIKYYKLYEINKIDSNGNRISQTEIQNGITETTTYNYDAVDRLKDFTVTGADTVKTEYTFEGYNRKSEQALVKRNIRDTSQNSKNKKGETDVASYGLRVE